MKTILLKNQLFAFLFSLLGILSFYEMNAQVCVNNPSIQQGHMSTSSGQGILQFSFVENLLDYTDEENDPIIINILLLGTIPTNGAGSVGGSFSSNFTWTYNSMTNRLRGIQNQDILGGTGGLITVDYDPINYGTCTPLDFGFSAFLTIPSCMNGINETFDDFQYINSSLYGSIIQTSSTDCNGPNGGASYFFGTGSFDLLWSTGETTMAISGLAAGFHGLTVTDLSNSCSYPQTFEIKADTGCLGRILGTVIIDHIIPDCMVDTSSFPAIGRVVSLYQNNILIDLRITDALGNYSFNVANGTYTVEIEQGPVDIYNCGTTNQQTVVVSTQSSYTADFIHDVTPNENLCVFHNIGIVRPGFDQNNSIEFCNLGSSNSTGTLTFVHDPLTHSLTASPSSPVTMYDSTTQTATWDFNNLAPGHCQTVYFKLTVYLPPTVNNGDTLSFQTSISPTINDIDLANNFMNSDVIARGSYDPNDKQNLVGESSWGGAVYPDDDQFKYYIRFQNTGTDTAFTVVIRDEIDANLDISSVQPVSSSHTYTLSTENSNTLVFRFDNILLVDSTTNEPASNGYVCFTIDLLPNLPIGTVIKNQAGIYFDYNLPVNTNLLVNTITDIPLVLEEGTVFDGEATIYPNPNDGLMTLDLDLNSADQLTIEFMDINGQFLRQISDKAFGVGKHELPISIRDLADGVYFVHVVGRLGSTVVKVVVQR